MHEEPLPMFDPQFIDSNKRNQMPNQQYLNYQSKQGSLLKPNKNSEL